MFAEIYLQQPYHQEVEQQKQQYRQGCPSLAYPALCQEQYEHNACKRQDKGHTYGRETGVAWLGSFLVLAAAKHGYLAAVAINIVRFCHVDFAFLTYKDTLF